MEQTVLVLGGGGQLGRELARSAPPNVHCVALPRSALDIADPAAVATCMDEHRPAQLVNAAAYTAVDKAESEPDEARRGNVDGPAVLAAACAERDVRLIHVSTDFVFDGDSSVPYGPADVTSPIGEYGASKLRGEEAVRAALPGALVLRTGWVYSAFGHNFVKTMLRLMAERDELTVVADQVGTPTWARGLALAAWAAVAKNALVRTATEALVAAAAIGYPVVIKPVAGAGTADTHGVRNAAELRDVMATMGHVREASVEEYIDGDEFTYDTVTIEGEPAFESIAQYHPRPLESRTQEWISPAQLVFRDPHQPALMDGVRLGRGVLKALGMGSGFTHMEWFRKSNGEVVFGEIGARVGGAKLADMMNFANDFDVFREWARAVCWHSFEATPLRRYNVACVFKRALGSGRIQRIEGLGALRAYCGPRLIVEDLLPLGHPRRDWKKTLLSDGCVIMRDPDYGRCVDMMNAAVSGLRVYAGG